MQRYEEDLKITVTNDQANGEFAEPVHRAYVVVDSALFHAFVTFTSPAGTSSFLVKGVQPHCFKGEFTSVSVKGTGLGAYNVYIKGLR